jgi:hypothetical protein
MILWVWMFAFIVSMVAARRIDSMGLFTMRQKTIPWF